MEGIHLQAALLCERAIHEKDGALSVSRIIDTLRHMAPTLEPFAYTMTALVILRSDETQVTVPLKIEMETPEGLPAHSMNMDVSMKGKGQNIVVNMQLVFKEPGLHSFNIYIDNQLAAKIPFMVIYVRKGGDTPDRLKVTDFVRGEIISPQ